MDMFRHNDITKDKEDIPSAGLLQSTLEKVAGRCAGKIRQTVMTAEGKKMEVAGLLKTLELRGHVSWSLIPP
jgi:predicted PP-loop superfamily ATPase